MWKCSPLNLSVWLFFVRQHRIGDYAGRRVGIFGLVFFFHFFFTTARFAVDIIARIPVVPEAIRHDNAPTAATSRAPRSAVINYTVPSGVPNRKWRSKYLIYRFIENAGTPIVSYTLTFYQHGTGRITKRSFSPHIFEIRTDGDARESPRETRAGPGIHHSM